MNNDEKQELKFILSMTNIFIKPKDREMYVSMLKKVTIDAMIPFTRIIVAGVLALAVTVYGISAIFGNLERTPYIWAPTMLLLLSAYVIIYYFMISSRGQSMLLTIFTYAASQINEWSRIRSTNFGELESLGIKNIKHGYLAFDNGDVGVIYAIAGQLSKTTLPSVAEQIASSRLNYLIARSDTSQEMQITTVKKLDTTIQQNYIKDVFAKYKKEEPSLNDKCIQFMSAMFLDDFKENLSKSESSVYQYLIIREPDANDITKAKQTFERAVNDGMLSSARQIISGKEIVSVLGPLALLSKKGEQKIVRKIEKNEESTIKFKKQA